MDRIIRTMTSVEAKDTCDVAPPAETEQRRVETPSSPAGPPAETEAPVQQGMYTHAGQHVFRSCRVAEFQQFLCPLVMEAVKYARSKSRSRPR